MCFRDIKHRRNISNCQDKQKVWAANCFLGNSRKVVKSEITAYLNHCSVKKEIPRALYEWGENDFNN